MELYNKLKYEELQRAPLIERVHSPNMDSLTHDQIKEELRYSNMFSALWKASQPTSGHSYSEHDQRMALRAISTRRWMKGDITLDEAKVDEALLLVLLLHLSSLDGPMGSSAVAADGDTKCSRLKTTDAALKGKKSSEGGTCTRTPSLSLTPSESETASLSGTISASLSVSPSETGSASLSGTISGSISGSISTTPSETITLPKAPVVTNPDTTDQTGKVPGNPQDTPPPVKDPIVQPDDNKKQDKKEETPTEASPPGPRGKSPSDKPTDGTIPVDTTPTTNTTKVTKPPVKSATAILSTIPAVLITSVVFLYLYSY